MINKKLIVSLVLIIVIVALVLTQFSKEKKIVINDRCGPLLKEIVHSIKDEDACKIKCVGQCTSIDMEFKRIVFKDNRPYCNDCECYCEG